MQIKKWWKKPFGFVKNLTASKGHLFKKSKTSRRIRARSLLMKLFVMIERFLYDPK